ncbi:DUF6357 family protein [Streptomyces parvus]|uniref:DUF6357 family protein n=1 Tax=Streptomyces parvus TaxID=66428 RepID=UPI003F4CD2B9
MAWTRSDLVFTHRIGWIPAVIREDGKLKLMRTAKTDANHEPRTSESPRRFLLDTTGWPMAQLRAIS